MKSLRRRMWEWVQEAAYWAMAFYLPHHGYYRIGFDGREWQTDFWQWLGFSFHERRRRVPSERWDAYDRRVAKDPAARDTWADLPNWIDEKGE